MSSGEVTLMGDRGAHFHWVEFQVHTPRDGKWKVEKPTAEVDRAAYSQSFVAAFRPIGLIELDKMSLNPHGMLALKHGHASFPAALGFAS